MAIQEVLEEEQAVKAVVAPVRAEQETLHQLRQVKVIVAAMGQALLTAIKVLVAVVVLVLLGLLVLNQEEE
jgi:uncharacterized membrane protein (Fun14 family)